MRSRVLRQIGLLDERFFLVYEETDWCFRARKAGFLCRMVADARVWHKVGASFGTEASPLRQYFSTRNVLLWAEKNASFMDRIRIVWRTFRRHVPRLSVSTDSAVGLPKRLVWAIRQYLRDAARMRGDLKQRASRLGLRDYFARRFGDCPQRVRAISQAWSAPHASSVAKPGDARTAP